MRTDDFRALLKPYALYLAWVVSLAATGGSLYLSEILGYIPCKLCWFQRIFMYPEVILLGIASYKNDRRQAGYVLPLSIIGGLFSLYHYAEQKNPGAGRAAALYLGCALQYGLPGLVRIYYYSFFWR